MSAKLMTCWSFQKLGSYYVWQIANSVLIKDKSVIFALFNNFEVLTSGSNKIRLLADNFLKNSGFDDSCTSLPPVPSITNLKLHNISLTPKLVKKITANLDLSRKSGFDCISVVAVKKCEPEIL